MTWLRTELALGLVSLADELRLLAHWLPPSLWKTIRSHRLLRCAYWLSGAQETSQ